jgi:phosphate-selective porin
MDTLGSSNATWFLERSYSDLWTPDRRVGLAYSTWGEGWQTKLDLFGQSLDETEDVSGVDQGWGAAARFSFVPLLLSETQAVHFGLAASTRRPSATEFSTAFGPIAYVIDFSGRPESTKVSKAKFLNLKMSNVDHFDQYGFEFAGVWKALSWQSEFQQTQIFRRPSQALADTTAHKFSTYYGQVSWIFGGQRTYEVNSGLFGRVTPFSRAGAWELVARYSLMNQDDLTTIDPVKAGLAKNLTLGLTYYLNKSFRWMLNYTKVDNNENAKPKVDPYGGIPNDDFRFISMRLQVVY